MIQSVNNSLSSFIFPKRVFSMPTKKAKKAAAAKKKKAAAKKKVQKKTVSVKKDSKKKEETPFPEDEGAMKSYSQAIAQQAENNEPDTPIDYEG